MKPRMGIRANPLIAATIAITCCSVGCARKGVTSAAPPITKRPVSAANKPQWVESSTPFPATNITAVGNVFWICGANEMVASSADGGRTWELRHSKRDGKVLLNIAFVNEKVGHAAGKDGILLSTTDGGRTWKSHNARADVDAFSFADANNGIAILGAEPDIVTYVPSSSGPSPSSGAVKLTHDGGDSWQDVALDSEEMRPFTGVLAVAALDSAHYLMIRREPDIEDIFLTTEDGGKSWKVVHPRNDATNREFAGWVFIHGGEYWAFGMELVNRKQGGGYGVPLVLHSRDGMQWTHGTNGSKEFGGCNPQGCYMWDGAVESLYDSHEQYWNLPQDFSLSTKWAIAGSRACTINSITECGPAVLSPQPQPRIWHAGGGQFDLKPPQRTNLSFASDCKSCSVKAIWPDPGLNWTGKVIANFLISQDGAVTDLSIDGASGNAFVDSQIRSQIQQWLFEPSRTETQGKRRKVTIDVNCLNIPDAPTIGGCHLSPG